MDTSLGCSQFVAESTESGDLCSYRVIDSLARSCCDGLVSTLGDLAEFIEDHRSHGSLTGKATKPEWNGDQLTVTWSCGVVFERWVTPWDAELDLLRAAELN